MILTCQSQRQAVDLAGVNFNIHKQDKILNSRVAAFGAAQPVARVLALDALAMTVRDDLQRSMQRRAAATITRAFADHWHTAVAHSEHSDRVWLFAVAEMFSFADDRTAWWSASGPVDRLEQFVKDQPIIRRLIVVHVAELMRQIRERAAVAGLDWSAGTFYLPPDHRFHVQWAADYKAKRDAALKQFDPLHTKVSYGGLNARQRREFEALM